MFTKVKSLHFVGIGGAGMSGIAEVLLNMGYHVSGSDLKLTDTTERLAKMGAEIFEGHRAENVEHADVVVVSSAVRGTNPELTAAADRKLPIIPRAEMLGELMRLQQGIAIAGMHGKTTTTSMVGQILTTAKLDPTIIVGGRVVNLDAHSKLGTGKYLVAEADEYDRSFLKLAPFMAVITTLEAEHLDTYKDIEDIKAAFLTFANRVPFYGAVVVCLDEPGVQSLIPEIEKRVITYGLSTQADLRALNITFKESSSHFRVEAMGEILGDIDLNLVGLHNVKNALAATGVGLELGIRFEDIREALGQFRGVRRRFEQKGQVNNIIVIDDYGHHPTEIQNTLQGASMGYPDRRIIAVLQPHLYSRTRDFYKDFGRSFFQADILIVTDIYGSREEPLAGISGEMVARAAKDFGHRKVYYIGDLNLIAAKVVDILQPGDMFITFGAGDVNKVGVELVGLLKSKYGEGA